MRIYISLPITGHEPVAPLVADFVRRSLQDVYPDAEIITPFDICPVEESIEYHTAMGRDIDVLLTCDAAYFVTGWQRSLGCRLERHAARLYNIQILPEKLVSGIALRRLLKNKNKSLNYEENSELL